MCDGGWVGGLGKHAHAVPCHLRRWDSARACSGIRFCGAQHGAHRGCLRVRGRRASLGGRRASAVLAGRAAGDCGQFSRVAAAGTQPRNSDAPRPLALHRSGLCDGRRLALASTLAPRLHVHVRVHRAPCLVPEYDYSPRVLCWHLLLAQVAIQQGLKAALASEPEAAIDVVAWRAAAVTACGEMSWLRYPPP